MRYALPLASALAILGAAVGAQSAHQPYSGLETREIAALSAHDSEDLEAGRGWGLALPAELNGYPGPLHVLDLAEALELTGAQRDQVQAVFVEMQREAQSAGAALVAAERALDGAFSDGTVTGHTLKRLVDAAAEARAALRYVHLSRHLVTLDILTPAQVERYAVLRGYADDPCAAVPDGHNAVMWRLHNGCDG
ncbi:MAG: Spy/CpxP family protein refolding chaperone [Pseudomonadota bacterium]